MVHRQKHPGLQLRSNNIRRRWNLHSLLKGPPRHCDDGHCRILESLAACNVLAKSGFVVRVLHISFP